VINTVAELKHQFNFWTGLATDGFHGDKHRGRIEAASLTASAIASRTVSTVINTVAELKQRTQIEDGSGGRVSTVINTVAELKPYRKSLLDELDQCFHGDKHRGRIEAGPTGGGIGYATGGFHGDKHRGRIEGVFRSAI